MNCLSVDIGSSVEDRHISRLLCEYRRAVWQMRVSSPEQCDALLSLP